MYTSFMNTGNQSMMGTSSSKGWRNRNHVVAPPSLNELTTQESTALMSLSQRILDGFAVVKHVMSDTAFIVYHEEFRQEFIVRKVSEEEDIKNWINLQTHSNIVTAFDSFIDEMSGHQFSMVEVNNGGRIYDYIKSLELDLAIDVPRSYLETVYDVAIQLATGLDFAHSAGLVHGQFDLSKVVLQREGDNIVYKITDFCPGSSMQMPLSTEANYWPFSKNKKQITDREKVEVLMLKDIYSLGICILELMIGRTSKQCFSISLDSLPLTWAEFPESTPIIQVLVECIQIDSITNRKGKLQHIRKLLIREYKKYFQRPFYKMEQPFVGKKADVYNKRGIVALFRNREGEALSMWQEARLIQDRHFDSQCNYVMHRWSTGKISDGQMMAELGQFVFEAGGKGECLECYLKIAIGQREEGMDLLKKFIEETEKATKGQQRLQNLKNNQQLATAKEVMSTVMLNKDSFFNNVTVKHGHTETIKHIAFSNNSNFMVSICKQSTKVWKVLAKVMGSFMSIPNNQKLPEEERDKEEEVVKPLCAIDNSGSLVIVYRGGLQFNLYKILDRNDYRREKTFFVRKEIRSSVSQEQFEFASIRDSVDEIAFLGDEPTHFRVYLTIANVSYHATVQLSDDVTTLEKAQKFSDQSIFAVEPENNSSILRAQQRMRAFVDQQIDLGNSVFFPSDDTRFAIVLNRQDKDEKHFMVYDVKRDNFVRKVQKKTNYDEAACVNASATLLTFVEGLDLVVRSIRLPNSAILGDTLRPRFVRADTKLNPGIACQNKQIFKDKLYRELHAYHLFKEDAIRAEKMVGLTEEQNVQLMVLKYEEAALNPYKMKANRELMMLQKVLLRDAAKYPNMRDLQEKCPLRGVEGLKRIEIYDDELTFVAKDSDIDLVQMSSEPHRNFFLIAMDGIVFKYDLVTKELLFQFKTNATKAMQLYDKDDKLVVASEDEIRLWDFFDHKEEAPELLTMLQPSMKVENLYINKNRDEDAAPLYVLTTCQNNFILYQKRLEKKLSHEIDEGVTITAAAFSKESTLLLIGTSTGKILTFDISQDSKGCQTVGNPCQAGQDLPVTKIECLNSIEDNNAFIVIVDGKEVFIYNHDKGDLKAVDYGEEGADFQEGEICNIQIAANNKFFCLGIPSHRALGFLGINRSQLTTKPLKWITKYQFVDFFADDHLSNIMLLDQNRKQLDYHFVIWKFETKDLDQATLHKLDVGVANVNNEPAEDIDSQESVDENGRKPVESIPKSSCCLLF